MHNFNIVADQKLAANRAGWAKRSDRLQETVGPVWTMWSIRRGPTGLTGGPHRSERLQAVADFSKGSTTYAQQLRIKLFIEYKLI